MSCGILWGGKSRVNVSSSGEDLREDCTGFIDLFRGDIEMSDSSEPPFTNRRDQHPRVFQGGDGRGWWPSGIGYFKHHDVGFHMLRCDSNGRNLTQEPSQLLRVEMIVGQTFDVVFQGIDAS